MAICPSCKGAGMDGMPCLGCDGQGTITRDDGTLKVCPACTGTGRINALCGMCDGTGEVPD